MTEPATLDGAGTPARSRRGVFLAMSLVAGLVGMGLVLGGHAVRHRGACSPGVARNACVANLRVLGDAREAWFKARSSGGGGLVVAEPTLAQLETFVGREMRCPGGGRYQPGPGGEGFGCTVSGHDVIRWEGVAAAGVASETGR